MNSDWQALQDFGEELKPPTPQLPDGLRNRVLNTIADPPQPSVQPSRRLIPALLNAIPKPTRRWALTALLAGIPALLNAIPKSTRRWALTALLAGTVAASLMAPLIPGTLTTTPPPPPPPAASRDAAELSTAQLLGAAASSVATAPALSARPDQFIYTELVVLLQNLYPDGKPKPPAERELIRVWRSVDDSKDGLIQTGPENAPSQLWTSTKVRPCPATSCRMNPSMAGNLPTDADDMYRYLYDPNSDALSWDGATPDDRALSRASGVLKASRHAPAVQAAVFEAIARIPGVSVRSGVTDLAGRQGVALVRRSSATETVLIFEPDTYRYLGSNRTTTTSTGGSSTQDAVLLVKVVDRAGQLI